MEYRDGALQQMCSKMSESSSSSTIAPEDLLEVPDLHDEDELPVEDQLSEHEVVEAFKAFDANGDGLTCLPDMRRMLKAAGADFSDDEFDRAAGSLTVDAEGSIDIVRFAEAFLENDSEDLEADRVALRACGRRATRLSGTGTIGGVVGKEPVEPPAPCAVPRTSFGAVPEYCGCFRGVRCVLHSIFHCA